MSEDMSRNEVTQIVKDMRERITQALTLLQAKHAKMLPAQAELITALLSQKEAIVQAVERLNQFGSPKKIRCHGDFHLGQVLNIFDDFVIFDFEGEPGRSIEERVQKQSPLKDVAGMIRSFNYAAYASLFKFIHNRPEDLDKFLPWASACSTWSTVAFLKGYRSATEKCPFVPEDRKTLLAALEPFVVDKAIYEITYELNNRPDWLSIPITGLLEYINTTQPGRATHVR